MQPILTIDLTSKETGKFFVPKDWEKDYLGAASLAPRILFESLTTGVNPLAPEAPLLFLTGPLTGTVGPSVGRFIVAARSPATGLWGESNCGGFWGPELRKAGYDGLLITGRSKDPVYLWIQDGVLKIMDASNIWGFDTYQTQDAIKAALKSKNSHVAVIGPGGESQNPMSVILTDHGRVAGRTGMGAVMGSKNLKAVAVRGHGKVPFSDAGYPKLRKEANRVLKDDNFTQVARDLGTSGVADYLDYLGEMPKKYFQSGVFDGVYNVTGATMAETILTGVKACHGCVIGCGREVQLKGERHAQKGPEYEMVVGFGPNLLIDDLNFITRMTDLTDRYGVDAISLTNTLGLAFSLYEQGVITTEDTGGYELQWGDKNVVEALIKLFINQEGFGKFLRKGARALGRQFGAEDQAMQVNGLEMAYHDPRGGSGIALSYATSPRGACHNQSDYFLVDLYGQIEESLGMEYFVRHAGVEKVLNVIIHQNWRSVFNSLVMCFFANVPPSTIMELINGATGQQYSIQDLLKVGERAWNLKRVINNRLGLDRTNDRLPKRLLEPYEDGGAVGYIIPFDEMMDAYYDIRGWDPDTGFPSEEKLVELGLSWVLEK